MFIYDVYMYFSETGYRNVHFHVLADINKYSKDDTTKIKETVASIVGCSEKDITVCGILPSSSFFIVLSIKEIWIKRLKTINQHDNDKLTRLNIDYFKDDLEQTAGNARLILKDQFRDIYLCNTF